MAESNLEKQIHETLEKKNQLIEFETLFIKKIIY